MRAPSASPGAPTVPFTQVHRVLRSSLEHAQDAIVVGLAVILFGVMVRNLISLGRYVLGPAINFRDILGETLFMMMLIELLRLLVIYLRDHHVAVDVMVETSIVATLREVILRDVVELSPGTILAIALFVIALGVLLRFGDLRVRRSRAGRAEVPHEGHASRPRRRPPSVPPEARPEPLSSPD
jgi:uncharacterized membrane protein (DUF373 family)